MKSFFSNSSSWWTVLGCLLVICLSSSTVAQRTFTVAGAYVGDGQPATSASLSWPQYATIDARGNIYVGDYNHCRLRRINSQGKIVTVAGTGICGFSGDGGPATNAQIYWPEGVLVDPKGNIFFSDFVNARVREITPDGTILTVAGNGTLGFCGDGGAATQACLNLPTAVSLTAGPSGEVLYIADTYNNRIRAVVLSTGIINTVAGNGNAGYSGDGGPATQASIDHPQGLAAYGSNLWISDSWNSSVRRVNVNTGIITTFVGNGSCGPTLCGLEGISVDSGGNLYIASAVGAVFEVEVPSGTIVTVAGGQGFVGFSGDGGPALQALFNQPWDAFLDSSGNILIVDSLNNRIRRVDTSGNISTIAGGYVGDGGNSTASSLNWSQGLAFDAAGDLYIADTWNHRVRKVSAGTITTIAGTGISGYSGDGGPAVAANLNEPLGVAADSGGNVYVADFGNFALRKIDPSGTIATFASSVFLGSLTTDSVGNIYASDVSSCVVWKFTPTAQASIVAGMLGQCGYNGDDIPATQAELFLPSGLALDASGNLYISDMQNNRVRVVNRQGTIFTLAGDGNCSFSGDGGPAKKAELCAPQGIGVDRRRNIYIADAYNGRIRVVDSSLVISTYAGTGGGGYNGNGLPALETNMEPFPLTVSPTGIVFYGDILSYLVREIH